MTYKHHKTLEPLSSLSDWELENKDQKLHGYAVYSAPDHTLGTVKEMLVDTSSQEVTALRLSTGQEISIVDVVIGKEGIYLKEMTLQTPVIKVY